MDASEPGEVTNHMGTSTDQRTGKAARRRFEPVPRQNGAGAPVTPLPAPRTPVSESTKEYFELAREHFYELERVAGNAVRELDAALDRLLEHLAAEGAQDLHRIEAFGDHLIEHNRTVAERSAHIRRRLERRGKLDPKPFFGRRATDQVPTEQDAEDEPPREGPTEGVIALTRQLAASGVSDRRICRVLTTLGVPDAEEAVKITLR